MKVSELIDILERHKKTSMDDEIVIAIKKPSFGPTASVPVHWIGFGTDWDNGRLLIQPDTPLVPKPVIEEVPDSDEYEVCDVYWEPMEYEFKFYCQNYAEPQKLSTALNMGFAGCQFEGQSDDSWLMRLYSYMDEYGELYSTDHLDTRYFKVATPARIRFLRGSDET